MEEYLPSPCALLLIYIDEVLRGASEVVFISNPISGAIIMAGLIAYDMRVAFHGILGLMVSTAFAALLQRTGYRGYEGVVEGLFGFNGLLVGLGIATFTQDKLESNLRQAVVVIIFSMFSTIVQNALAGWISPMPCFTLPFNLCVMTFLGGTASYRRFETLLAPQLLPVEAGNIDYCIRELMSDQCDSWGYIAGFLVATIRGVCEIYLANSDLSGILIIVAMLLHSPTCACLVVLGSALGAAVGLLVGGDPISIYNGLWGFNSALTCCAVGSGLFGKRGPVELCWAAFGSVITVFIQYAMAGMLSPAGLVGFTAPFCIASLLMLGSDLCRESNIETYQAKSAQGITLASAGGGGANKRSSTPASSTTMSHLRRMQNRSMASPSKTITTYSRDHSVAFSRTQSPVEPGAII